MDGDEVVRRLGAGGYGTVDQAYATTSLVALKVLPLERSRGWEEREVDMLRRMRHPGVVRLLGYVDGPEDAPRVRVLIMEYRSPEAWDFFRHHLPHLAGASLLE